MGLQDTCMREKTDVSGLSEFGAIVTLRMEFLGLRQHELSSNAGLSQSYVSRLMRGKQAPTVVATEKLADALDLKGQPRERLFLAAGKAAGFTAKRA